MSKRKLKNRCAAKSKTTGKRCKQPAVPGKKVCHYHGGAKGSGQGNKTNNTNSVKHGFYSDVLPAGEREIYQQEIDRAKPTTLEDEIALVRVKIRRYCDYTNTDFNFDKWEDNIQQEFVGSMQGPSGQSIPVQIKKTIKKPLGPDLLLRMLDNLRKLMLALHTITRESGEGNSEFNVLVYGGAEVGEKVDD